ncbi:hypothetical protein ARMGADRAFT_107725 [Armillaria gallica]|uniref:Uncharacterized protein n=1 Tax=Armillaria gallica TaxID=47427 RepID=A0A2H3DF01_ARMGA|nr:hypothetical protein ARMGADRAFT_107725 [Armillaria gallica]
MKKCQRQAILFYVLTFILMSLAFGSSVLQESERVQDSSMSVLLHLPPGVFFFWNSKSYFSLGCSKCAFPYGLRHG